MELDNENVNNTFASVYTPESLAWDLYMNNNKNVNGRLINFIDDNNNQLSCNVNTIENKFNSISGSFEILITTLMELIYYKLYDDHFETLSKKNQLNDDLDIASMHIDFTINNLNDFVNFLNDKIKNIDYMISVNTIENTNINDPNHFGQNTKYYCKIISKDTYHGEKYFLINRSKLDFNKKYTFLLNILTQNYEYQASINNIRDLYAVIALNNVKLKINFIQLNINNEDIEMI